MAKLHLNPDAIVYDIGAGTGSVSIECAIHLTKGEVYAIERKEEAASLIEQNAHKASADHVHVIRGIAPDVLQGLPKPTHVFVGGSSGRLEEILDQVREANPHVRIVEMPLHWRHRANYYGMYVNMRSQMRILLPCRFQGVRQ